MRRSGALLASIAILLVTAGSAEAEIVRDGKDVSGPLDLRALRLGQHDLKLPVTISASRPLPSLEGLGGHPSLKRGKTARYLCLDIASGSIGRLLLCPSGKIERGRIDVGVSDISGGRAAARGSMSVPAERSRRSLSLGFGLHGLGLKQGKLRFSARSSWYGPECGGAPSRAGSGQSGCADRAPQRGEGSTMIRALQPIGCAGFDTTKVFNGPRNRKAVALTFDDGPSIYTPEILRILAEHHARATFFAVGELVPPYASTVRDIVAQGHEIANHSLRHESGPGPDSLRTTSEIIEQASGFRPCMFRPPGGYLPSATLAAAQAMHMVSVLWDIDTQDYNLPGPATIKARATSVQPGSIVLMHDGGGPRNQTVAALPGIIENLQRRGYRLVTMTEILGGHYRYGEVRRTRRPLPDLGPVPARIPGP